MTHVKRKCETDRRPLLQYVLKQNISYYICNSEVNLKGKVPVHAINPYSTAFPYGNDMVLHFYQQQESSTTKTVHSH